MKRRMPLICVKNDRKLKEKKKKTKEKKKKTKEKKKLKEKRKKNLSLEYFLSVKLFAGIQRQNRRIYQKNMCYNKYRKIIACSFQK